MSRLNKPQLFAVFEQAIVESGWWCIRQSGGAQHPADYLVYRNETENRIRVYIWNLTHGGGTARPADEYRIQITGVERFAQEAGTKILILGWWGDVGVFAGFDHAHHSGKLGKSPSIQISEPALRTALINGFAPYERRQGEIAIAFRPDFIGTYIDKTEVLHRAGRSRAEISLLRKIGENPNAVSDIDIERATSATRRYAILETRRAIRDINFRARVLTAYRNQCAVCGVQLKLVEGAHVVPAILPTSTDETCNGIALCVLHHRAYDNGLLTFDDDYRTHVRSEKLKELEEVGLHGGAAKFTSDLRPVLLLPADKRDHPRKAYVSKANRLRGWKLSSSR